MNELKLAQVGKVVIAANTCTGLGFQLDNRVCESYIMLLAFAALAS